jgi:beta-N-acetylhexosaminidase
MFTNHKAIIFGPAGPELLPEERAFFSQHKPLGFILFRRNIVDKKQVAALVQELRDAVDNQAAPILVDQEGGRVCRMRAPIWYEPPAAAEFGRIALESLADAKRALNLSTTLIALDLLELGITSDAIPVLDVINSDTHNVIGDRAFGSDKSIVAELGRVVCDVLTEFEVAPIIKHIPGHGRAKADSHKELPIVTANYQDLIDVDFYPFKELNDVKLAMTAHVLYEAIDPHAPGTVSNMVIDTIRNTIGFKNLLLTDCILMEALAGSVASRAKKAIEAGCDIVLQSRGTVEEMEEVITSVPFITAAQNSILEPLFPPVRKTPQLDRATIQIELLDLFEKYNIETAPIKNLIDPTHDPV